MIEIPPEILPVLDLKQGQVVHGVAGHREKYQPLVSRWTPHAHDPIELTTALSTQLGLREYYVADLDAIRKKDNHFEVVHQLVKHGLIIWLDAGFTHLNEVEMYLRTGLQQIIICSECLPELSLLHGAVKQFGSDRIVFSLDFMAGQVRGLGTIANLEPETILQNAIDLGVNQFILLDVADVGTLKGPSLLNWCRKLKRMKPDCTLITGGGVRHRSDINSFQEAGADRVLVSTWLHSSFKS